MMRLGSHDEFWRILLGRGAMGVGGQENPREAKKGNDGPVRGSNSSSSDWCECPPW